MSGHDIPDPGAPGPEPQPAPGWRALPAQARNLFMLSGLVLAVPAGIAARLGMRALDLPGGWTASLVAALLGALAGSWMGLRRYRYTRWLLDADGFSLRRGRTWQSEVRVPVNRVQHLDVRRGPLERHYGLATLVIHTAGTRDSAVNVGGLAEADAEALRDLLANQVERDRACRDDARP